MGEAILDGPAADLGAVELEGIQAEGFGGGEAVRARRRASQTLFEEVGDVLGPDHGVVATGGSWSPEIGFLSSAGSEVIGGECIEATAGKAEFFSCFDGRQRSLTESFQDMSNEGWRVAIG